MPIPFLEALRGRLAPVFNGTVPLEREKEIITNWAWLACQGLDSKEGTNTRALHKCLQIRASTQLLSKNKKKKQCTERGFKVEPRTVCIWLWTWCVLSYTKGKENRGNLIAENLKRPQNTGFNVQKCVMLSYLWRHYQTGFSSFIAVVSYKTEARKRLIRV